MNLFNRTPKKIFVYGGSFDPPHFGHVEIVQRLAARKDCQKVLVVPAFNHKQKDKHVASYLQRVKHGIAALDRSDLVALNSTHIPRMLSAKSENTQPYRMIPFNDQN